jgi:hypothetical protein
MIRRELTAKRRLGEMVGKQPKATGTWHRPGAWASTGTLGGRAELCSSGGISLDSIFPQLIAQDYSVSFGRSQPRTILHSA